MSLSHLGPSGSAPAKRECLGEGVGWCECARACTWADLVSKRTASGFESKGKEKIVGALKIRLELPPKSSKSPPPTVLVHPALLTKLRSSSLVLQVACCYFLAGGFLFACARGFCARWRVLLILLTFPLALSLGLSLNWRSNGGAGGWGGSNRSDLICKE